MRSKLSMVAVAGCVLALALGFGWYSFQAARGAEAALAAINQKLHRLDERVQQGRERVAAGQRQTAALQPVLQNAPAAALVNRPASVKDPATLMASDPKLRDLYLKSFRANLKRRWKGIYQIIGLSAVQTDKFEELSTAREDDKLTIRAAALAQGVALNDDGIKRLQQQSLEQFNATAANELGAALAQQLDQIHRLEPVQQFVNEAFTLAAPESLPLTNSQAAQLLQILANSRNSDQSDSFDPTTVDWDKATAQAAMVLSSSQLEAFNAQAQLERVVGMVNQFYAQQKGAK